MKAKKLEIFFLNLNNIDSSNYSNISNQLNSMKEFMILAPKKVNGEKNNLTPQSMLHWLKDFDIIP